MYLQKISVMIKNLILIVLLPFLFKNLSAQTAKNLNREGMKKISILAGKWEGDAVYYRARGESTKFKMEENIQWKLDSLVLLFDGTGKLNNDANKGTVAFQALSILSYQGDSEQYKYRVYLEDGRNADVIFKQIAENNFEWNMDVPSGKMKYDLLIDPASMRWNEKGYFSKDGITWSVFFEMNLYKEKKD